MQWLRLWHDFPNDPKWRTIAKLSQCSIADVTAVAIHLLVQASANANERGRTHPNASEQIASALDTEEGFVVRIITAMEGRFLKNGKILDWQEKQPKREDGSAERAKRWRETKKEVKTNASERNRTEQRKTPYPLPSATPPPSRGGGGVVDAPLVNEAERQTLLDGLTKKLKRA